jgi:hypothetical protein
MNCGATVPSVLSLSTDFGASGIRTRAGAAGAEIGLRPGSSYLIVQVRRSGDNWPPESAFAHRATGGSAGLPRTSGNGARVRGTPAGTGGWSGIRPPAARAIPPARTPEPSPRGHELEISRRRAAPAKNLVAEAGVFAQSSLPRVLDLAARFADGRQRVTSGAAALPTKP